MRILRLKRKTVRYEGVAGDQKSEGGTGGKEEENWKAFLLPLRLHRFSYQPVCHL